MKHSTGKLLLCLLDISKVLLTSVYANGTAKGTQKYFIYGLNLPPASTYVVPEQHAVVLKDSSSERQWVYAAPRHSVSWLLCLMQATVQYLH